MNYLKRRIPVLLLVVCIATALLLGMGARTEPHIVLKVWSMGAEGSLLGQLVEGFEREHPGIRVNVQAIPWEQAHNKLVTAVASMTGPDVFQMGTTWIPEFADAGVLVDLTPHVEQYQNLRPENFFPASVGTAMFNGAYVGVPWYVEDRVLFYRTDLLAEVGFPEGPATWKELKEAAARLTDRQTGRHGMLLDSETAVTLLMLAWQNGATVLDGTSPRFASPEFLGAVEFMMDIVNKGYAPRQTDHMPLQAFAEGAVAMLYSGPWMVDSIRKHAPSLLQQYAVRTVPRLHNNTSFLGGSNLAIFSASRQREAALAFLNYMARPDVQVAWYKLSHSLPSSLRAWDDPELAHGPSRVFREQMRAVRNAPFIPEWDSIERELMRAMEKIRLAGADPRKEMERLDARVVRMLEANR